MKQYILNEEAANALSDTLDHMFEKTTGELQSIVTTVEEVPHLLNCIREITNSIENFSENVAKKIDIDSVSAINKKLLLMEKNIQNSFDSAILKYKEILVKNLYDHMDITSDYKDLVEKKSAELFKEIDIGKIEYNIQEQISEKLLEHFGEDRINSLSNNNVVQLKQNIKKQEVLYQRYFKNLMDQNSSLSLSIKGRSRSKSMENIGFYLLGFLSSGSFVYLGLS